MSISDSVQFVKELIDYAVPLAAVLWASALAIKIILGMFMNGRIKL